MTHPHARKFIFLALLLAALGLSSLAALGFGAFKAGPGEIIAAVLPGDNRGLSGEAAARAQSVHALMWAIRLPRLLGGLLIGAALAVCGASMQGMFRNPLADPGLIGVSSGGALGAVMMIVFKHLLPGTLPGWGLEAAVPLAAFAGAVATTLVIYKLSLVEGRVQVATMLLAGIAINSLVGAAIGYTITRASDAQLREVTFWNLGSLAQVDWNDLKVGGPLIMAVIILLPLFSKAMNAMLLGDAEASRMGVRTELVKRVLILLTALAVGASVAAAGTIGFVGLVVPHLVRMWIGADHRFLLPASALLGAILLVLADLLARTVAAPMELPIGMITALLGAPFFLYLLMTQRKSIFG